MDTILIIFMVIICVLAVVCGFQESKLTGLFKANKVYGRFSAYIALSCTFGGLVAILSAIIPAMKNTGSGFPLPAALGMMAVGILIYARAYMKCPPPLKGKCIPCMMMSGFGIAAKIAVFFLPFVWQLSAGDGGAAAAGIPETLQDERGYTCRTRISGDFIYIQRPDGSEDCIRSDYIHMDTHIIETDSHRYRW